MSILVGKRNFAENFSEMMISDFSRDNIYRSKMALNEHNLLNRGNFMQINQAQLLENAKLLKEKFQLVPDNEILTVLDDCDNNMDIAIEILQKDTQPKIEMPALIPVPNRAIRKLPANQNSQKISATVTRSMEQNKQEIITEEEPAPTNKLEDLLNWSSVIIDKLQTLGSMDEAKLLMANVIHEIKSDAEKKEQENVRKLQNHKAILIKAFTKQREKTQSLEEKNTDLNIMLSSHEQETSRLKQLNYKLELRLKTFDISQGESHNYDVY